MKKILLPLTIALIALTIGCNSNKTKVDDSQDGKYAVLLERNEVLAQSAEWAVVKSKATELMMKIEADSNDLKSRLQLAQIYMQEARITGEHPYYYPATLKILDDVIRKDPNSFEALAFKASVLLSLHHFEEAKEVGQKALVINSDNGFIYGVLCDANVELGNYEEAVKMSDKMQLIRPGLESYSRASYLREIYGQDEGAIEAMKLAFEAGLPGTEEASWAGNTLIHLYINAGDYKNANQVADMILAQRPSYAFAIDAKGQVAMAEGKYDEAIKHFEKAITVMPEFSFYENMADAYKAKGDDTKYKEIYKSVIPMLEEDAKSGHYTDMEMALVYTKLNEMDKALEHAKKEYDRRPSNIDVNATMAWVLYNKGDMANAKKHLDIALRTGKKNKEMMKKADMINKAQS